MKSHKHVKATQTSPSMYNVTNSQIQDDYEQHTFAMFL
jgi:hypothetical protein